MRKSWRTWITGYQMEGAIHLPAGAAVRKISRIITRGMTRETRKAEIPAAVQMGRIIRTEVPGETGAEAAVRT